MHFLPVKAPKALILFKRITSNERLFLSIDFVKHRSLSRGEMLSEQGSERASERARVVKENERAKSDHVNSIKQAQPSLVQGYEIVSFRVSNANPGKSQLGKNGLVEGRK